VLRVFRFSSAVALLALASPVAAQSSPNLVEVLARLAAYLENYEQKLSTVVAAETYEQRYQYQLTRGMQALTRKRLLKSDFVFLRLVRTKITVTYRLEPKLGFLVPSEMVEHYYRPADPDHTPEEITAIGTYTAFRQFQTTGRIVTDR
jgi:hypothetical protein